jgi:hypothetical protein
VNLFLLVEAHAPGDPTSLVVSFLFIRTMVPMKSYQIKLFLLSVLLVQLPNLIDTLLNEELLVLALGDDLDFWSGILFGLCFFLIWAAVEDEPASGLAKAEYVSRRELHILLLRDELLVHKSAVSTPEIVDKEVASVFVLQDGMSTGDCRVLLENVNVVLLSSNHIVGLLRNVYFLNNSSFFHYLKSITIMNVIKYSASLLILIKRFRGPEGFNVITEL